MARHYNGSRRTITSTELRRNFGVILQRLRRKREHTVIEKHGAPVAVILSMAEYDKLTARRRAKAAFHDLSHNLGREVEKLGMTEEEFLADLEKTKRRVFSEQYGRPA